MIKISPTDLIDLTLHEQSGLLRIEIAYARTDNQLFGERIYKPTAKLITYKTLAEITVKAAEIARDNHNLALVVYDSLRTTTAQQRMLETQIVQDNPHWLIQPRLLSPPGGGAHPRGMAIDVSLQTQNGTLLDMGTPFDQMCEDARPQTNKAHRDHPNLTPEVKANRKILDHCMLTAAKSLDIPLIGLPEEWWDYRFPAEVYEQYAPLSDDDLPEDMRCC